MHEKQWSWSESLLNQPSVDQMVSQEDINENQYVSSC